MRVSTHTQSTGGATSRCGTWQLGASVDGTQSRTTEQTEQTAFGLVGEKQVAASYVCSTRPSLVVFAQAAKRQAAAELAAGQAARRVELAGKLQEEERRYRRAKQREVSQACNGFFYLRGRRKDRLL
jgi:hypothetical protein